LDEPRRTVSFRVDAGGRLVGDAGDVRRLGLADGDELRVETGEALWVARRPVRDLARIYVEPTNRCNLSCRTCVRNAWDAPSGFMPREVFDALLDGLRAFPTRPLLFFGGFGEPLAHPEILSMLASAREAGTAVELITNGILLGEEARRAIVALGVRRLWVSVDGATPEGYQDVRLGDALPLILENLRAFRRLADEAPLLAPRLGIAFVAMRRNVGQLPAVVRLGRELGMDRLLVTNVVAYTEELRDEMLYDEGVAPGDGASPERPDVLLPRLEPMDEVRSALAGVVAEAPAEVRLRHSAARGRNFCPFVEAGSTAVRWDGSVSPCLPLFHEHAYWLGQRLRHSYPFSVGSLRERSLSDIWNDPAYVALRRRIRSFDFSPCCSCNTCELADDNRLDCTGSPLPACGGCLWAQGLIQCP